MMTDTPTTTDTPTMQRNGRTARREVYSVGVIARALGVSTRTVCKWVDSGVLDGYRLPGSLDRRVTRVALSDFARLNPHLKGLADAALGAGWDRPAEPGEPAADPRDPSPTALLARRLRSMLVVAFLRPEDMTATFDDDYREAWIDMRDALAAIPGLAWRGWLLVEGRPEAIGFPASLAGEIGDAYPVRYLSDPTATPLPWAAVGEEVAA